jgi:ubiquinone/menaquinone biosynthesis C-methylase UbiE
VVGFPQRQEFLDRMAAAGFTGVSWEELSAGTVCIYQGSIPA